MSAPLGNTSRRLGALRHWERQLGEPLEGVLRRLYLEDELPQREIAERLGMSDGNVTRWARSFGIPAIRNGKWSLTPHGKFGRLLALIDASGDCWEWMGYRDVHGYGGVYFEGRQRKAHTLIYTLLVGPIPDGLELDHLCQNKVCVNPDHLEPVTHGENTRRANLGRRKPRHDH